MFIKRKELEIFLEQLEKISQPKITLEQYATSPRVAANLLWFAGIENNHIFDKVILDLGCGSGILGIGAAYLGARAIIGLDFDYDSLLVAQRNCQKTGFQETCHWLYSRAEDCLIKGIDTTIMNPPFGMRKESISRDRVFLQKALSVSNIVYSIIPYAETTRLFFKDFCKTLRANIEEVIQMNLEINYLYQFHKKKRHIITVDMYKIAKK